MGLHYHLVTQFHPRKHHLSDSDGGCLSLGMLGCDMISVIHHLLWVDDGCEIDRWRSPNAQVMASPTLTQSPAIASLSVLTASSLGTNLPKGGGCRTSTEPNPRINHITYFDITVKSVGDSRLICNFIRCVQHIRVYPKIVALKARVAFGNGLMAPEDKGVQQR